MGVLDRWDRRNQKVLEAQNEVDQVVEPGVVAMASARGFVGIAGVVLPIAIFLISHGTVASVLAGAVVLGLGSILLVNLGRDFLSDWRAWRSRKNRDRST